MTLLEQLVTNSGESIGISKDINDNFVVWMDKCSVYNDPGELCVCGIGKTVEQATKDYIQKISGKTLVFNYATESERFAKLIFIFDEVD
jgi:hypothetical protein